MGAKTLDDLQDLIDDSLAWRRIELSAMTAAVQDQSRKSPNSPLARALARSSLAMLYAHWEGFTKDASQAYVDFVVTRRLKVSELSDGFALVALRDLSRREGRGDRQAQEQLLDSVRRPESARGRIPRRTAVNTKSNLRYEVLIEILDLVGIAPGAIETKRNLIDASLCDARNEIAHGKYIALDADQFIILRDEVVGMLEWLRDKILEAARMQAYRHDAPLRES